MTISRIDGVIVSFNGPDGLGEIQLEGGERVLFGLRACLGWRSGKPDVGLRVRVGDIRPSLSGRLKAHAVESVTGTWCVASGADDLEDDLPDNDGVAVAPWVDPHDIDVLVPNASGAAALRELDRVAWDNLKHAYTGLAGAADRVPTVLRGLVSPDDETRDNAYFDGLLSVIWHQGSVYEATAHALPFLAAVLADPDCPARRRIGAGLALILRDAYRYGGETGALVLAAAVRADDLLRRAASYPTEPLRGACQLVRRVTSTWHRREAVANADLDALQAAYEALEEAE